MKFLLPLLFFIILLTTSVSSLEFGISPSEMYLEGEIDENICRNFTLIGDERNFSGELKLSETETRNVESYNLHSGDFRIVAEYPKETNSGKQEICIKGLEEGEYYGALLYKVSETSYGVGMWITLNTQDGKTIQETKSERKSLFSTGRFVQDTSQNINQEFLLILLFLFVVLIFVLGYFIGVYLSKKPKNNKKII